MTTSAESLSNAKPRARGIPFGYIVAAIIVAGIAVLIVATVSGGRYELLVGSSSRDIRLTGAVEVPRAALLR